MTRGALLTVFLVLLLSNRAVADDEKPAGRVAEATRTAEATKTAKGTKATKVPSADEATFHGHVVPILEKRCIGCHGGEKPKGKFSVELDPGGRPRFWRPDGSRLPAVPRSPRLGKDPVADLEHEHRSQGVTPGPDTTTPLWLGEPLDLGLAIDLLRVGER